MKIAGVDPSTLPDTEVLVLPRGDQKIVFTARGLRSWEEFNKLCPEPVAPKIQTPKGVSHNFDDAGYLASQAEYSRRKLAYLVIKSLEPSDIEWDTVVLDNPSTWANWKDDMRNAGLTEAELNHVFALCWDVNQLNERKLEEARKAFLRGPGNAA